MKIDIATAGLQRSPSAELALPRALDAGDLDAAAACFARDGCLITPDATAIHGRHLVRSVLAQLIAQRIEVAVESSHLISAGDVRLVRERWRIRTGVEGARLVQVLHPSFAMRRVESEWKLAIAAPWGWGGGSL
jgi:ketosteroid isomerase-like protein